MMKGSYDVSYFNDGFNDGVEHDSSVKIEKRVSIASTAVEAKESNDTKKVSKVTYDQEAERPQWDNQIEFILSAVGYAVGLGNVWRFPFLAYTNGGGSFLIPYTLMLFFAGLPLFFMELALGQYSGQGPTRVFGRLAPAMKGLGFAMIAVTFYVSIYYNVILGWTLFYMFSGMRSELPWTTCDIDSHHCVGNSTILLNATKFI